MLVSRDSKKAVIEWSHWKRKSGTAQRGDEGYVFDDATGLIREIRAYDASPAVKEIGELAVYFTEREWANWSNSTMQVAVITSVLASSSLSQPMQRSSPENDA